MTAEITVKIDIDTLLSFIPNCDSEGREIIVASEREKIKDLDKKDFVNQMNDLLTKTIFEAGHKFEENDLTTTLMIVCDDLLREFPFLTTDEIRIAYRKGVRKLYGEYYGITAVSLYNWIVKYVSDNRNAVMKLKREAHVLAVAKQYEKPVPTKEEWQKIMYQSSLDLFEKYKTYKKEDVDNITNLFDVGNVHYQFLYDWGLINFSESKIKLIRQKAELRIRAENSPSKANGNANRMSNQILLKAIENKEEYALKILDSEVKRVSTMWFFDDLILEKKELKDVLDQKILEWRPTSD